MTRRIIALLLAIAVSGSLFAAPRPRPIPRPRHRHAAPHARPMRIPHVPWQAIIAGGASGAGIVFAYKIADGIQTATVEAAKASPESFIGKCTDASGYVHVACAVIVIATIAYIAWLFAFRRRRPPVLAGHDNDSADKPHP